MPLSPEDKLILIGGCSVLGAGVAVFCGLRAVADSTRAVVNSTQAAAETLANSPGSLGLARLAGAAEAYVAEAGQALGAVGRSSATMTSLATRSWLEHLWPGRRWVTAPPPHWCRLTEHAVNLLTIWF